METFCYDFKWILKVGERQIQKKICHTTEWPLIAKKGTVCPPPPFCIKLGLPSFLFTSNESMTPSI